MWSKLGQKNNLCQKKCWVKKICIYILWCKLPLEGVWYEQRTKEIPGFTHYNWSCPLCQPYNVSQQISLGNIKFKYCFRCLESYLSNRYPRLQPLNREAAEQFNSVLRMVTHSVSRMTFDNYLTAINVFVTFFNHR